MNLVASKDFILPEIGQELGVKASKYLRKSGVNVLANTKAVDAGENFVKLNDGTVIPCMTLVWAAGLDIDPVILELKCEHDKHNKLIVDKHLRLSEHDNVFALGDCALISNPLTGKAYPTTAQNSIQQSIIVVNNLYSIISGKTDLQEFHFKSKGMMTTLGRRVALAVIFGTCYTGSLAWAIWRTYYLSQLPLSEKKFQVATSWLADLFFKRDLTFIGKIKSKTLTTVNFTQNKPSIKDYFKDL